MSAVLTTDRLRLRRLDKDDLPRLYALFQDPLVMRYYPGLKDMDETTRWLEWVEEQYARAGHGLWAVELQDGGQWVGQIGLIRQSVDDVTETEIGYLLRSEHWHRGYATEAAIACRDYGFHTLRLSRLISLIRPENEPSIRVATRVGMRPERMIRRKTFDHWIYSIERPI
jgi:RimJ/RimL family protein N-acetyltransferase